MKNRLFLITLILVEITTPACIRRKLKKEKPTAELYDDRPSYKLKQKKKKPTAELYDDRSPFKPKQQKAKKSEN